MLIIGHRGSSGTSPENSLAGFRQAIAADADMIELDIRLTRDRVPVLGHNLHLFGTKRRELALLRRYTFKELHERSKKNGYALTSLDQAMAECFGKIYMNLEIKEISAVRPTIEVIKKYAHTKEEWDSVLLSSFKPLALRAMRNNAPDASLGMLHHQNPWKFIGWHKRLNLSAVGFNQLYLHPIPLAMARKLGVFTYVYTVNEASTAKKLAQKGIDGIVTDYPKELRSQIFKK